MHYTVDIPNIQNRFGYQENIYNLGNFIATPAVYENGAWVVEPYVDLGDAFYTEIADYKVAITVPEGFKVAATGVETDGVYIADDVRDFALALPLACIIQVIWIRLLNGPWILPKNHSSFLMNCLENIPMKQ